MSEPSPDPSVPLWSALAEAVTARLGGPDDEPAIQALFKSTFGVDRSGDEWRWRFIDAPSSPQIHVLELEGELVGHMAYAQFMHFLDGERRPTLVGGDWMYRADLRGQGINQRFAQTYREFYGDAISGLAFPSAAAQAVAAKSPRTLTPLFEVPQWVRWRTGRAVHESNPRVPSPVGRVLTVAQSLAALGGRPRSKGRTITPGWADAEELDALVERTCSAARCIRVRDAAYLRWRWRDQPGRSWSMVACHDRDGRLGGWAVAGLDPSSPRRGRIVDLLAEDSACTTALVAAAHARLIRAGAEVTTCELHDPRPWARSAMHRAGFIHRPGGPMARCGPQSPEHADWALPSSWYVTSGDTDFV
jgi:hypothetical protein